MRIANLPITGAMLLSLAGLFFEAHGVFADEAIADKSPQAIFDERIVPIFKSPNPSSCVQCHLAGVDLKNYILDDADKTFRNLRDQGLVDLDKPEKSKILALINRGAEATEGAALIHAKNRAAELAAFSAWIVACAADPKFRDAPKLDAASAAEAAAKRADDALVRHARSDRVLESFERNVWAWRFRCMGCHAEGSAANDKHRREYGDQVAWMKKEGAAATMDYLLASNLIDIESPDESLLLRKPLGDEDHQGGKKFAVGDQGYRGFRRWIEDVAAIRGQKYKGPGDLPRDDREVRRFGSDIWLKLADCPPEWGEHLLQADVFAFDDRRGVWEASPIATTDRLVSGKLGLWQHNLTLLAAADSDRAKAWQREATLPAGRYLVKVYVDRQDRLARDWRTSLGENDFVGQIEIRGEWRAGYGGMTAASAKQVAK